jgi:multidrug efflux pump subunit AcrA (membrane-fusion protein)
LPKLLKVILPVLILALTLGIFAYLRATRPEKPVAAIEERVWRVAVEPAHPRRLAPQLVLHGRVENPDLLKVAASGPARVAEVAVRDGQRVATGDLLVRLDERDFLPALQQAEAARAELEAQIQSEILRHERDAIALDHERRLLDLARAGVARAERLKTQQAASDADLDAAEEAVARQSLTVNQRERDLADHPARLAALEARLASARAKVADIALDLERAVVRAPFDGLVAGVEVTAGDQVKVDALLLRLYALADLEVRALIPAPYQAEITAALEAGTALTASARLGDRELKLRLERLAGEGQASGADGLFRVIGGGEALRLGQIVELRLSRPAREGLIAVPFGAVQDGNRLYRVEEGRLRGIQVEALGPWSPADTADMTGTPAGTASGVGETGPSPSAPAGEERLLVHAPDLRAGDALLVTHLPNAIDGLRVEVAP